VTKDPPSSPLSCNKNVFQVPPFNKIDDTLVDKKSLTHLIQSSPKLLYFMIINKASCSIESNAFSKSNLRIIIGFLEHDIDANIPVTKPNSHEYF
jgi:hypothetical protein